MSGGDEWIQEMVDRGLLTPEQARAALAGDGATPPTLPPPAASAGSAPVFLSCAPCGQVFTAAFADPARLPACPACGGPTRLVQLGGHLVSPLTPPTAVRPPGERPFGRYILRRELGRGGMGVVFEAWDPAAGRTVALKMLSAAGMELDEASVARFLREARSAAQISHPGIVAVHEIGQADGRHFFTMELIDGPSLETRLAAAGAPAAFPLARRLEVLAEIAAALGFAHARGIVHRDIKPSNILFTRDDRPKLSDFGLAKEVSAASSAGLTLTGLVLGTPHYMSPEQAAGRSDAVGPASDVFSFGVMLYRAATGRLPFEGEGLEALHRIWRDPPAPIGRRRGLPAGLPAVVMRCLEKDPAARYRDGGELAEDLKRLIAGEPVEAPAPRRGRRRGPAPVGTHQAPPPEALRLLELGRPSLERILKAQYETDVDEESRAVRLADARRMFEEATRLAPGLPLGPYLLGLIEEQDGDIPAAERSFRAALTIDPEFGPAHYWLGRTLLLRSWVERMPYADEGPDLIARRRDSARALSSEACRCFEAALVRGSGFEDELHKTVAQALAAHGKEDREAAVSACVAGLAAFPRTPGREDFHWVLGLVASGEESLAEFGKALEIRPRFPVALYARSRTFRALGRKEEVLRDVRRVAALWPRFVPGWISYGFVCMDLGLTDEALAATERAIQLDPTSAVARMNRAYAHFQRKEYERAIVDCTRAIELDPSKAGLWGNRGTLNGVLRRLPEAVSDLREAARLDPSRPTYRNDLGVMLLELNDWSNAEQVFTDLITELPDYVKGWNNRGTARLALRRYTEATADFDEAIRLQPAYPEAWRNRAEAQLRLGDAVRAETDASRAIQLRPGYANAWRVRAATRLALARPAEALADAEEALRLAPADPECLMIRGRARRDTGDRAGGAEDFRGVLAAPQAAEALKQEAGRLLADG